MPLDSDVDAPDAVDTPLAHADEVVRAVPPVDPPAPGEAGAPRDAPPGPAKDAIQDVQLRGITRWSPRRAGVPALLDWWPAYFLVGILASPIQRVSARSWL